MARTKKPQRVRVRGIHRHHSRALLIEKLACPMTPDRWSSAAKLARVRFDFGQEALVPAGKPVRIKTSDTYEEAFADPTAFAALLREGTPHQQASRLAHIACQAGSSTTRKVVRDGEEIALSIGTTDRATRYLSIFRKLEDAESVALPVALLIGWLAAPGWLEKQPLLPLGTHYDDAEYKWGGGNTITLAAIAVLVIDAIAVGLAQRFDCDGWCTLSEHVSAETIAKLAVLTAALRERRYNGGANSFDNLDFLAQAAAGDIPGGVVGIYSVVQNPYVKTGRDFGLELDLPVITN